MEFPNTFSSSGGQSRTRKSKPVVLFSMVVVADGDAVVRAVVLSKVVEVVDAFRSLRVGDTPFLASADPLLFPSLASAHLAR